MRALAPALALFLALAGCAGGGNAATGAIPGSAWVVERIVQADGAVVRGSGASVQFGRDGSVFVEACNACNGRFRVRGGTLRVDEALACTRRACAPGGAPEVGPLLGGDHSIARDGQYLVLTQAVGDGAAAQQILLLPATAQTDG